MRLSICSFLVLPLLVAGTPESPSGGAEQPPSSGRGSIRADAAPIAAPAVFRFRSRRSAQPTCKFARRVKRFFRRVRRAFSRAGRRIKSAFSRAGRTIKSGFKKVGRAIKRGFQKAGQGLKKFGRKVKKAFQKAGRKIKQAFTRRKRARQKQTKKLAEKHKPSGLAALLGKRQSKRTGVDRKSRFQGALQGLGKLVSVEEIVRQLQQRVGKGEELPGDSLALDYQRWKERIANKELPPDTPPPGSLPEDAKPKFEQAYVKTLVPDLKEYTLYIYDKVFARSTYKPNPKEAVELLHKYGCKQISRLMPGFAKVVQKKIVIGVDLVGDWNEEIPPQALQKEPKKKSGAAGTAPEPKTPPRIEIVEICTVTNEQLEATLRRDLTTIVNAVQAGTSATTEDDRIHPLSERGRPRASLPAGTSLGTGAGLTAAQRAARLRAARLRAAKNRRLTPAQRSAQAARQRAAQNRRLTPAQRAAQAARLRAARNRRLTPAQRAAQAKARARTAARKPVGTNRPTRRPATARRSPTARQPAAISSSRPRSSAASPMPLSRRPASRLKVVRWSTVKPKLFTDLGTYDPALKGEKFHDVAKRLVMFYRKAGDARNFGRAEKLSGKDISKLGDKENIPKDAQKDIEHQAAPKTVETRNHREVLRRKVDQWSYGYEYEQIADSLQGKGGRLLGDYNGAEKVVLESFWNDCTELQSICQEPQTRREKTACIRCAEEAVQSHCVDGKDSDTGKCRGKHEVRICDPGAGACKREDGEKKKKKGNSKKFNKTVSTDDLGGSTFVNWLALQLVEESRDWHIHRGYGVTDLDYYKKTVVEYVVERRFLPSKKTDPAAKANDEGKRKLDALPITAWQRCVLWNPYYNAGNGKYAAICDDPDLDMAAVKKAAGDEVPWHQARVFQMALAHSSVQQYLNSGKRYWEGECKAKRKRKGDPLGWFGKVKKYNCNKEKDKARRRAMKWFSRDGAKVDRNKRLKKAGKAITAAIMPVVGKLLGMLLKAAGMFEMMKTLAKAAGLTPEQSADCEDPEYRHDVMKLPAKQDHKRGCLLKVFAKNFASTLESLLVMLGNKLVDWGVDLLRTALQGVKSAILAAAASVPFAGGFLATLVDIGWELIMNFGAKMLLKGFVVSNLPKWFKIRELAKQPFEKVLENPIVQVVAGIIITLIDAAVAYGDKGWMAVGVDAVLNTIQSLLQGKKQWFWIRALTYAKKEMRKSDPGDNVTDQILHFARAMVAGFGSAISRKLDADSRNSFDQAVDEIKALLTPGKIEEFKAKLMASPVKALTELIGQKIGPVVMPVVTSLVPMPSWAKKMLNRIGSGLSETIGEIVNKGFDWKKLVGRIVGVFEPVGEWLLGRLPISDEALRDLVFKGYRGIVGALKKIDTLKSEYLEKPWNIVKALVGLTGDYIKKKVTGLIKSPKLGAERQLVTELLDTVLKVLSDETLRNKLFPNGRPDGRAILAQVGQLLGPYVKGRLQGLVDGTGLEGLVGTAVDAFFGPKGPFGLGAQFFTNLGTILKDNAGSIVAEVLKAIGGIVKKQLKGSHTLGVLLDGIVQALGKAAKAPGGIAALFKGGTDAVVKFIADALEPLIKEVTPETTDAKKAPISKLLRDGIGGLLKLLTKAKMLSKLPAKSLQIVSDSVKKLAPTMIDLLRQVMGNSEVGQFFKRAIEALYEIFSTPTKLKEFLGRPGPKLFAVLVREAKEPLGKVVFSAVRDPVLKPLARDALKAALEFVSQALDKGASGLGQAARNIIANLVPTIVTLAKKKIGDLFPAHLSAFKNVVDQGFDTLGPFVAELIKSGKAAWDKLVGGGAKVLGKLVKAFLPMLKAPITNAVSYKPLRGLLTRLLDSVGNLIEDPAALVRAFKSSKLAMQKLLPELGKVLGPFAHDVMVKPLPPGIPRNIVEAIVNTGQSLLEKPEKLDAFIQKAKTDYKSLLKDIVAGLAPALLKSVPNPALRKVFEAGLNTMTTSALK